MFLPAIPFKTVADSVLSEGEIDEAECDSVAGLVCKICDFGLSRKLQDVNIATTSGTFRWMSPEVMKSESVSFKSDV